MNLAYVRVSTIEQNEARQLEALEKHNIDKWYTEKVSAKSKDRPELNRLLDNARKGDNVYIKDFSRLARSTTHLISLVEEFKKKGVNLISLKESLDTSTPTGKMLVTMISSVDEFERTNMLERQKEGIAIAVKEGKFKGGQPKKLNPTKWNALYKDMKKDYITKTEMAERLGISRSTLYRRLEQFESEQVEG